MKGLNARVMFTAVSAVLFVAGASALAASDAWAGPGQSGKSPEHRDLSGEDRIVFATIGDQGTGKYEQYQVSRTMKSACQYYGCQFVMGGGDNFYPSGVDSVYDDKWRTHFELPYGIFERFDFWMVAGNHDWRSSVRSLIEYTERSERWRMPDYDYAIPDLPRWVSIYGFDTQKMDWDQVNRARDEFCGKDQEWRFAFGHHPIYSNGSHGNSWKMDYYLEPLIRDCGLQVYYAGHDHHQEHITGRYFEQIVQGAGAKLRHVDQKPYRPGDDRRQNFAKSALGFSVTEVTSEEVTVHFVDVDGEVIYEWEVTQSEIGLR